MYAESLIMKRVRQTVWIVGILCTDRCDPLATAARDARPVKAAHLGIAFGIRTGNLASNFTLLEERLHPRSLRMVLVFSKSETDRARRYGPSQ